MIAANDEMKEGARPATLFSLAARVREEGSP